jgi:hypothetical protein
MDDFQVNFIDKTAYAANGSIPFPMHKPVQPLEWDWNLVKTVPTIKTYGPISGGSESTILSPDEWNRKYLNGQVNHLPVDKDGCHTLPDGECISKGPCIHDPEDWAKCDPRFMEKDPHGKDLHESGSKADSGKIRPWLMFQGFARALEEVAKVTTEGALKYTPNGWVEVPEAQERYFDAFMRHLLKLAKGKIFDNEPGGIGTYHMSQVIWNLLAVFELQLRSIDKDEKRKS